MANICDNHFLLQIRNDNREDFESCVKELKNDKGIDITYEDKYILEGYFDSRWVFPKEEFEKIIKGNVYFRCISEEYGCNYVAMNIYNNGWEKEQTFKF